MGGGGGLAARSRGRIAARSLAFSRTRRWAQARAPSAPQWLTDDRILRRRVGAVADSALVDRGRAIQILLALEKRLDGQVYLLPKLAVIRSLPSAP